MIYWYLTNMSLKYNIVLVWAICLSCKVVMTGCVVVLVNRSVADSFRVGEDGCTNNASVCPISTTCQSDGLCLCSDSEPNFRNPNIIVGGGGGLKYGGSHGCVSSNDLRHEVGSLNHCVFGPFQLIPYSHQDPASKFSDIDNPNAVFKSCFPWNVQAKFPDNATKIELQWLNNSYVDLTVFNATLDFKWKRSVLSLQGTIITLQFKCALSSSNSIVTKCLRAKVLGTWPAAGTPVATTEPATPSSLITPSSQTTPSSLTTPSGLTTQSTKPATSDVSSNTSMATSPTSSARTSPPGEVSGNDDDSSGTIIIIAVVVPVVLLIVLVVVVWYLCKRKRRNSQRRSSKKNDTAHLKQFSHIDSNLRRPDAYGDGQVSDANLGYSTPDSQRVIVEANPMYATPDIKRKEDNYNPPGYEQVNMKKRQSNEDDSQADPGYATPDVNRREINRVNSYPEPGYETPDIKKKEINAASADSAYSTPDENTRENNADIERINVNGDLYALPDKNKNTKKINGLNYMDPSRLVSGSQDGNESQAQSDQPTEYAEVVGVMKPAQKKKKK